MVPTASAPDSVRTASTAPEISPLRLAWDHVPSGVRRAVIRAIGSERIRLTLLDKLGIRKKSGFIALSNGGPAAIELVMKRLATEGPVGDYYEFGLYRGYTFWYAQQAAGRAGLRTMRFLGFDSFAGLPDVEGQDRKAGIFIPGDYACTRNEVERQLTEHGFDWSRATLTEGFFDVSLTPERKEALEARPAALVMVDCDLYQSTVPVLDFLADLLQDGTVVLFDDWYCFGEADDQGEPRAFREFLEEHGEWRADPLMDFPTYGKAFVMRSAPAAAFEDGYHWRP
jgi:O-methyltransferase